MPNKNHIHSWDSLFPAIEACYDIDAPLGCDLIGNVTVNLTDCDKQGTYDALVACAKKYPEVAQHLNLINSVACEECGNTDGFTLESSFNFSKTKKAFDVESFDDRIICGECSSDRCVVKVQESI